MIYDGTPMYLKSQARRGRGLVTRLAGGVA
jgi:hypothetical protein